MDSAEFYRLIEEIRKSIEAALEKTSSKHPEHVRKAIEDVVARLNLGSTYDLLNRYYESNDELQKKLRDLEGETARNQQEISDLLENIIELLTTMNKSDNKTVCGDVDELLHGEEYKFMQMVRDFKEIDLPRKIRNLFIAAAMFAAFIGAGSVIYTTYTVSKQTSVLMEKISKIKEVGP